MSDGYPNYQCCVVWNATYARGYHVTGETPTNNNDVLSYFYDLAKIRNSKMMI